MAATKLSVTSIRCTRCAQSVAPQDYVLGFNACAWCVDSKCSRCHDPLPYGHESKVCVGCMESFRVSRQPAEQHNVIENPAEQVSGFLDNVLEMNVTESFLAFERKRRRLVANHQEQRVLEGRNAYSSSAMRYCRICFENVPTSVASDIHPDC